jgi:hypothetical protein
MDNITLITVLSLSFSFIIIMVKICIKSKCNEINFCGIKIKRDIKSEVEEHKYDIEHNIKNDEINELKQSIK